MMMRPPTTGETIRNSSIRRRAAVSGRSQIGVMAGANDTDQHCLPFVRKLLISKAEKPAFARA